MVDNYTGVDILTYHENTSVSCPLAGSIARNCSSGSLNCTHGITLRPCCLGLHSQCEVMSEQNCTFMRGHWYKDKVDENFFCQISLIVENFHLMLSCDKDSI